MKSKFSIAQIIVLSILLLICLGLGSVLVLAAIVTSDGGKTVIVVSVAGLVFLAMGVFAIRYYLQIFNTIEIRLDGIAIKGLLKNRWIAWDEIKVIRLTGKKPERLLFTSMPMEAVSISMTDGSREIILTKYYSNIDRIRMALYFIKLKLAAREAITADCLLPVQRAKPVISDTSRFQRFGGNILTFNSLVLFALVFLGIYILVFSKHSTSFWQVAIPSLAILINGPVLLGYQLHYFSLNEEYLIVKNHIWLWRNDIYLLKDIREIVFEDPNKLSTSLRVITTNYESKLYPAGSLRNKDWRAFREVFRSRGIRIRNEASFD